MDNITEAPRYFIIVGSIVGWTDMVLVIIGVTGNLLIIRITFSKKIRIFTKTFLLSEAGWDILVLLFAGLRYHQLSTNYFDIRTVSDLACTLHSFITYFTTDMSAWTLIVLSLERYLILKYPLSLKIRLLDLKKALFMVGLLLSIGVAKNFVFFFSILTPDSNNCYVDFPNSYLIISYMDMIFTALIPSALVFIFTSCTIILLGLQNKKVNPNAILSTVKDPSKQILRMILVISIYHFISSTPLCVTSILANLESFEVWDIFANNICFHISFMLSITNNSVKFYLYLYSSYSFRRMFLDYILFTIKDLKDFVRNLPRPTLKKIF